MTSAGVPKSIVLLSDGTGNSSAKLFKTNVWRMYEAVDLTKPDQVAMYDDGVGSSSLLPLAILGGALGFGLKRNVLDLYMFACRNYRPGDRLYAFGFSRGAFTIRVLIDLIASEGLIVGERGRKLERLALSAYRKYRRGFTGRMSGPMSWVRDLVLSGVDSGHRQYKKWNKKETPQFAFVGLWDTVDAYGLPVDELTHAVDKWIWPLTLNKAALPTNVEKACHALALDDERQTFHPVLIDESGQALTDRVDDERVTQVWFSGMHSNVGGGYPDDSVAHVTLRWMGQEAQKRGLRLHKPFVDAWSVRADASGPIGDSRRGLAAYYRYDPRRIAKIIAESENVTVGRPKIHHSVFDRIRQGRDDYAPIVLPDDYAVVDANGAILTGTNNPIEHPTQAKHRSREHERIWNSVWARRGTYFASLAATVLLVVPPLVASGGADAAASGSTLDRAPMSLSRVVGAAARLLPDTLSPLGEYYRQYPLRLLLAGGLLGAVLWLSRRLKRSIVDRTRKIWDDIISTGPKEHELPPPSFDPIQAIRTNIWYRRIFWFGSRKLAPAALLATVAVVALGTINRFTFAFANATGTVCQNVASIPSDSAGRWTVAFHPRALCQPTGVEVEPGKTYRVQITLPQSPSNAWKDRTYPVESAGGFGSSKSFAHMAALPWRRLLTVPWFVPTVRIGAHIAEYHPIDKAGSITFTARQKGQLFLFVNDAVGPWFARGFFYDNNVGDSAVVVVARSAP